MKHRGKAITFSVVVVGLVVLTIAAFAGKDWIREEWWICKLQRVDAKEQALAAGCLGQLGSLRAMPLLFAPVGEIPLWILYAGPDPEDWALSFQASEYRYKSEDQRALWAACLKSLADISLDGSRNVEPVLIQALRDE